MPRVHRTQEPELVHEGIYEQEDGRYVRTECGEYLWVRNPPLEVATEFRAAFTQETVNCMACIAASRS